MSCCYKKLSIIFCVVFCFTVLEVCASDWEVKKVAEGASPGAVKWCGNTDKIVWQTATNGIHLSDEHHKKIFQVSHSWKHTKPFCSKNGRYIFFLDENEAKVIQGKINIPLKSYDETSKVVEVVKGANQYLAFSPNMDLAVSTKSEDGEVQLPTGETIPVVKASPDVPGYYQPGIVSVGVQGNVVMSLTIVPLDGVPKERNFTIYNINNESTITPAGVQHQSVAKISPDEKTLFIATMKNYEKWKRGGVAPVFNLNRLNVGTSFSLPIIIYQNIQDFDVTDKQIVLLVRNKQESKILLTDYDGRHVETVAEFPWLIDQVSFSFEGNYILFTRDELPAVGFDGPDGPPIGRSIYVLSKSVR